MKNNKKLVLSAIALSVLTAASAASNAASKPKLNKVIKAATATQSSTLSFADWQAKKCKIRRISLIA